MNEYINASRRQVNAASHNQAISGSGHRIIMVSNREPYRHEYGPNGEGFVVDRPTGGLTASLDPAMQQMGGTWIAWGDGEADFDVVDADDCVRVPPDDPSYTLRRVWLSEDQVDGYYYGFSNQVLWPICHSALPHVRCSPRSWNRYREVNQQFANAVIGEANGQSVVWFHDYHLALAPRMARAHLPRSTTQLFYWHIPWPSWDTFRACPHARSLLRGLLATDHLGFHVPRYRTNFLECVDAAIPDAHVDWEAGEVTRADHTTRVEAIPMSVPFEKIHRTALSTQAESAWSSFSRSHGINEDSMIAIGVERLDYTKGILEKLRALEGFWETHPDWQGRFTYIQNASESRSEIPEYQDYQDRVEEEVDRITARFGTNEWDPIIYTTETLSNTQLYSLYQNADMAIVSPIRDGLNLVAKEYISAQVNGNGILVLSDQTGVHDELGEHTYTVTPADIDGFASTIATALATPIHERKRRMDLLRRRVATHDLTAWLNTNLQAAQPSMTTESRRPQHHTP